MRAPKTQSHDLTAPTMHSGNISVATTERGNTTMAERGNTTIAETQRRDMLAAEMGR